MHEMTYMTKSSTSFNKQMLDYWVFFKGMYNQRGSLWRFSSTVIVNRGNSCELKPNKNVLARTNEQIYISFRKFSKRTNLGWLFSFFTFGSKRRLVELLSYGEYNQRFISLICFLETARLSVLFLIIVFFSFRRKLHLHNFFCCWKLLITAAAS